MQESEKKMLQTRLGEIYRLVERGNKDNTLEAITQLKDDIARPDKKYYDINQTTWNTTNR